MRYVFLIAVVVGCGGQAPKEEPVEELPTAMGGVIAPTEKADAAPPPPPPEPPPPDPDDPRSPETIRRVIYGNHQNIVECANANAVRDQPIVGKITVAFRVEADGVVKEVDIEEDPAGDEEDFMVCLRRELRALKFPPAQKRLTVRYPFNFKGR